MYLYVDAAYLRKAMADRLWALTGVSTTPHWPSLRQFFRAERVFVYDCIDDIRRDDEKDADYDTRLRTQADALRGIGLLDGVFVRLGSLRGNPGRTRQKEVDVLLAVDMLTHAHRKAAQSVILLAGDLDFKPVVEAVVDLGVALTVAFEQKSGSIDLALAADRRHILTAADLWQLSEQYLKPAEHPTLPRGHYRKWFDSGPRVGTASTDDGPIYLCKAFDSYALDLTELGRQSDLVYWSSPDERSARNFAEAVFGHLAWSEA